MPLHRHPIAVGGIFYGTMKGRITIKHIEASTLAGLEQSYSGPLIKIGTSNASHVCFDPDDDAPVKEAHCEIHMDPARVWLVDSSGTGDITLNGDPVSGTADLQQEDVIRIGPQGPSFRVLIDEMPSAGMTQTVVSGHGAKKPSPPRSNPRPPAMPEPSTGAGPASAGTAVRSPKTVQSSSPGAGSPPGQSPSRGTDLPKAVPPSGSPQTVVGKRRPQLAPGELPPVRVGFGNNAAERTGDQPSASEPPGPNKGKRRPKKSDIPPFDPAFGYKRSATAGFDIPKKHGSSGSVGMNTLMGVVSMVTQRERKRQFRLLVVASLVVVFGSVITAMVVIPRGDSTSWTEVAENVRPSVCLAMRRLPGDVGREGGFGTVWSVGDGVFATNAHVAEVIHEEDDNGQQWELVIRTPGGAPENMRVDRVVIHPGYKKWQELVQRYNPYDPGEKVFLSQNNFTPFDVALMYINKSDAWKQPKPLKLASGSELSRVRLGSPIASFGYPQEGIMLNTKNPEPEGRFGELIKMGDAFLRSVPSTEADFLWYNWGSAGGASGSPVFNEQGKVISLLSAGNVVGQVSGVRVAAGDSTTGPHVNALKELLDGTAESKQEARDEAWVEEMQTLFTLGTEASDLFAERLAAQVAYINKAFDPENQRIERTHKTSVSLTIAGGRGRANVSGLTIYPGINPLIAVAKNRPTAIWAYIDDGQAERPDEIKGSWSIDARTLEQGTLKASAVIESATGEDDGSTEVVVYTYRVVPK